MSVRAAQRDIDAREFEEWRAYSLLEPWDETRADWRAGIIASTLANIHRGKDTEPFSPGDFMPQFEESYDNEPTDEDAMIAQLQGQFEWMVDACGGVIREGVAQ